MSSSRCSQKHESSLGIETAHEQLVTRQHEVPKSMNPLWGLKLNRYSRQKVQYVPKSMNPLWGLKRAFVSWIVTDVVPKSMNPLWGLKLVTLLQFRFKRCSQKHESSLGIETYHEASYSGVWDTFPKA